MLNLTVKNANVKWAFSSYQEMIQVGEDLFLNPQCGKKNINEGIQVISAETLSYIINHCNKDKVIFPFKTIVEYFRLNQKDFHIGSSKQALHMDDFKYSGVIKRSDTITFSVNIVKTKVGVEVEILDAIVKVD